MGWFLDWGLPALGGLVGCFVYGAWRHRQASRKGFLRYGAQLRESDGPWQPGRLVIGPDILRFEPRRASAPGSNEVPLDEFVYCGQRKAEGRERLKFMPGVRFVKLSDGHGPVELALVVRPLAAQIRTRLTPDHDR